VVASTVNGQKGLWVGFTIDGDAYWLLTDPSKVGPSRNSTWVIWLAIAAALSLAGAAFIARLINQPLRQLSFAASRMRDGDFDASLLDEKVSTSEIREVNIGFNRMAEQLSKIEQDRVIMLAGISHDLRTPLARLRLETEMSVSDKDAREHMAADISQLDAIIDKFLDYARPEPARLENVSLNDVIEAAMYAVTDYEDMRVTVSIPDNMMVLADEVELSRVISNLLENARRYGKTPETGVALVDIVAKGRDEWVLIKVRDHGMGVAAETLPKLTRPFFRGDAARTAATGAGLGLAIVEKTIHRMGGVFGLANTASGGLSAHIKLRRSYE
jgi:two-component system osmolarity sensor histidine kinase EnvZ